MSKSIIDYIRQEGTIVVFDVDGVLAPYEWGVNQHCMSDKLWDSILDNHEDIYARVQPVQTFLDFIHSKRPQDCYVCSRSAHAESAFKAKFCTDNYGIPENHICLVDNKSDKLLFLNSLRDELGIPESRIAIVEDTVKTLDEIAKDHDYITVHISSFL